MKSKRRRLRETCARKVPWSEEGARASAERLGWPAQAYKCDVCNRWHVGRPGIAQYRSEAVANKQSQQQQQQQQIAEKAPTGVELVLPEVFQRPVEPVKARFVAPYVTFCHSKRADELKRILANYPSAQEGQMFLMRPESVHELSPAKMTMLCCKQYWASVSASGEVLAVTWDEQPRPFKEHIECVVLVYLADEIVPANVQFRSTKCPAGKVLADALHEASQPEWADRSPQHAETMVCGQPFMRYYGEVSIGPQRISKASGLPYKPAQCTVRPTGIPEWRLLKAFTQDPAAQEMLQDAADRFTFRMDELKAKAR